MAPPDTQDYPHVRIPLRNTIIVYAVIGLLLALVIADVLFWTVEVVRFFCGDDSLPSAVFLSALVLWCLRVTWGYLNQRDEREDDYEFEDG